MQYQIMSGDIQRQKATAYILFEGWMERLLSI